MLGISTTNLRVNGFRGGIDADAKAIYNRIIADSGVSNLSRLNYLVKGLKTIYGSLSNTPVCYDAHWIGYQPANGVGATSGQACAKLYSLTVAGDAVQATASAQPLLLAHNGAVTDNYWYGSGVSGNYVSTPNAVANQITGDIEIIVLVSFTDLTNTFFLCSKIAGPSNWAYEFTRDNNNKLVFSFSLNGTTQIDTTSTLIQPFAIGVKGWLKVTRNSTTGNVIFYTSSDGTIYTQLGTTISAASGAIFSGTRALGIGSSSAGSAPINGKIYRATISNSIGGTPVVDFNPASYNAATSQTQWTSATSEVWTINTGTATTGYKGVLVDRTIVQSDGVDDNLTVVSLASTQAYSEYIAHRRMGTGNLVAKATGNSLSNNATNFILNNGVALNLANTSLFRQLITTRNNGASSGLAINNGTETTGDAGTNNGTTLVISGGNFGINTYIQSISNDGSTTRTAMYNFIKTLNNNAF